MDQGTNLYNFTIELLDSKSPGNGPCTSPDGDGGVRGYNFGPFFGKTLISTTNCVCLDMGVSMWVPQNGWFIIIKENPIEMDDLGVPLFLETPIW